MPWRQLQDFVGAFPDGPYSDQAKGLLKKLQAPVPFWNQANLNSPF